MKDEDFHFPQKWSYQTDGICCKISINVAKKISNFSLVPNLFPKIF